MKGGLWDRNHPKILRYRLTTMDSEWTPHQLSPVHHRWSVDCISRNENRVQKLLSCLHLRKADTIEKAKDRLSRSDHRPKPPFLPLSASANLEPLPGFVRLICSQMWVGVQPDSRGKSPKTIQNPALVPFSTRPDGRFCLWLKWLGMIHGRPMMSDHVSSWCRSSVGKNADPSTWHALHRPSRHALR